MAALRGPGRPQRHRPTASGSRWRLTRWVAVRTVRPTSAGSVTVRRTWDSRAWPTSSASEGMRSGAGIGGPGRDRARCVRREVEEVDEQLGAGHPVDRGVVDLADHGHVAVVEALHHVDLPQGPGPVEGDAHDGAHQLGQLQAPPGARSAWRRTW